MRCDVAMRSDVSSYAARSCHVMFCHVLICRHAIRNNACHDVLLYGVICVVTCVGSVACCVSGLFRCVHVCSPPFYIHFKVSQAAPRAPLKYYISSQHDLEQYVRLLYKQVQHTGKHAMCVCVCMCMYMCMLVDVHAIHRSVDAVSQSIRSF